MVFVPDAGLEVFYRLGSSIEHTGAWGFGTLNPPDHAKYAEVLDLTHDGVPTQVDFRSGRLTAVKADRNSAAYFVTFERKRQLTGR